ncbi:hypothetical protein TRVL_05314 [Trypanosoma vivax]|nr:hypothetical protein TRVL_05314 [Trypanosoma vivax]
MRPPVPYRLGLHLRRCHPRATKARLGRTTVLVDSLAFGLLDRLPAYDHSNTLWSLPQEQLPPYLALMLLRHCWAYWTLVPSGVLLQSKCDGTEKPFTPQVLLSIAEECLQGYCREVTASGHAVIEPEARYPAGSLLTARSELNRVGHHFIAERMLEGCDGRMDVQTVVTLLRYAVAIEDTEGATISELIRLLVNASNSSLLAYEANLRTIFVASQPVHIAPVVLSVLRFGILSTEIIRLCMHHVSAVVRGRQTGVLAFENALGGFYECAVAVLHWLLDTQKRGPWARELCIQIMSCLKHAPLFLLCDVYTTMEKGSLITPSVQCKFLANCGIAVAMSNAITPDCANVISRVFGSLMSAESDTGHIEEGLVHGCAALIVMGRDDLVRSVYTVHPSLRETPHSVMSHVRCRDVVQACRSLLRLAESREEGWINIPLPTAHAIRALCTLVGRHGAPSDVVPLYRAIVSFHNPGMIVSQYMEYVLSGVCDRIASVNENFQKDTPPRIVLEYVIPFLRAVITCIGDDVNADMFLVMLETSLRVQHFAVPLTASIVWVLQRSKSLALIDLFSRADPSTNGIAFLNYFSLCYARDRGLRETVEHLCAVWRCDAVPILKRHPSLAPPCKLWKCAACGRSNSDRFNYCLCSALRNGFVVCRCCRYVQDERWASCQACGNNISESGVVAALPRRAWSCTACGANNPARQISRCFRCRAPLGPAVVTLSKLDAVDSVECSCADSKISGKRNEGEVRHLCRACGWFRESWAAANSLIWRCEGCGMLRSSLERTCPDCPHVDYLPFAIVRKCGDPISCPDCGSLVTNCFRQKCSGCEGAIHAGDSVRRATSVAGVPSAGATDVMQYSGCCATVAAGLSGSSVECCGSVCDPEMFPTSSRRCDACTKEMTSPHIAAACLHCYAFLLPFNGRWSAAVVRETLRLIIGRLDIGAGFESIANLLAMMLESLRTYAVHNAIGDLHEVVMVEGGRIQGRLSEDLVYDVMGRRIVALVKQLQEHIDQSIGIVMPHFQEHECRHCLGTHSEDICPFSGVQWLCEVCGAEGENADICRYVCRNCLSLRPCVQEKCPTEVWECPQCQRANVDFELYCIFCGMQREAAENAIKDTSHVFPFVPAKCPKCSLVHLEALCPLCHNDIPEVLQEVEGTVCMVTNHYAFIQPTGTEHPGRRVYVGQQWLRKRVWVEGEKVVFTARLNLQGGLRITSLYV